MQCGKLKTYLETGRVVFLPVRSIRPNPMQPRQIFDQEALEELAESIGCHGVLQPLSVRRQGNLYELIAGERRLRAAKLAGLEEVPCLLMNLDENQSALVALVENLQRKDLDYIEEARGLARLMQLGNLSQEQAAAKIGKSQSAVANKLRLLRHSVQVLEALRAGGLTERHARALLRLPGEPEKLMVIDQVVKERLTVAQTEEVIKDLTAQKPGQRRHHRSVDVRAFLTGLTENLAKIQSAGISAISHREETEREITLTITIRK